MAPLLRLAMNPVARPAVAASSRCGAGPARIIRIPQGALHRSEFSSDDGGISSPPAPW